MKRNTKACHLLTDQWKSVRRAQGAWNCSVAPKRGTIAPFLSWTIWLTHCRQTLLSQGKSCPLWSDEGSYLFVCFFFQKLYFSFAPSYISLKNRIHGSSYIAKDWNLHAMLELQAYHDTTIYYEYYNNKYANPLDCSCSTLGVGPPRRRPRHPPAIHFFLPS